MANYYKGSDRVLTESEIQALLENAGGPQVGDIKWVAHNTYMDKWLLCDGSAQSNDNFPELYSAIGTLWGSSGSYGFLLPDFISRTVWGSSAAGTYKKAGLPNIEGDFQPIPANAGNSTVAASGALYDKARSSGKNVTNSSTSSSTNIITVGLDASLSNAIYGNSTTVQPPAATLRPMIYTGRTNQGIMTVYKDYTVIKDGQTVNVTIDAVPAPFLIHANYTAFSAIEVGVSVTFSNPDVITSREDTLPPPGLFYYPGLCEWSVSATMITAGTTDVTITCANGASLTFTIAATYVS